MIEWALKSWPKLFAEVASGQKHHDLRRHDRAFAVGDTVRLREWDPEPEEYTGRALVRRIAAMTSADNPCAMSDSGLRPGFCILSLAPVGGFNIVAVDNFGRDYNGGKSERLLGSADAEQHARLFAFAWNQQFGGDQAPDFAEVREADRPLYVFEGY